MVVGSQEFARHPPKDFMALGDFALQGFRNDVLMFGPRSEVVQGSSRNFEA
jgi:hypothetical protein